MKTSTTWAGDMRQRVAGQLQAIAEVQEDLAAVRGRARSRDGALEVTVGPTGVVLDIRFAPAAYDLSPGQLSSAVLETIEAAVRQASQAVTQLTATLPNAAMVESLIAGRVPDSTQSALQREIQNLQDATPEVTRRA